MEFASKIKGARAILDWSREDLAAQSGLSVPGIHNLENGSSPNARTQKKIIRAFENAGIVFTRLGFEKNDSPFTVLNHDDPETCYLLLLDDVARILKTDKRPELLIMCADDSVSSDTVNNRYREIRNAGASMRQLIEAGNTYILGPLEEYRCIPSQYFINRVSMIYGDNVAMVTAGETTITILRDPVNAERERNTFNLLWSMLEPPTESTADERE